jgi:hypothetical protein
MRIRNAVFPVLFGFLNSPLFGQERITLPKANIIVHVVDQDGKPVEGARVGIGGTMAAKEGETAKGMTSLDGIFVAEVRTNGGIGTSARKDGYYDTFGPEYRFSWPQLEKAFATGRLEPPDSTIELLLKKIVNPTPMYARSFEGKVPFEAMKIGFDLMKADWVAPYGAGTTADLHFRVDRSIRNDRDYSATLALTFSNNGDGIRAFQAPARAGSILKSPHVAPEDGYVSAREWRQARSPGGNGKSDSFVDAERPGQNYFFRVRTVLDEHGHPKSALYGKIYGEIRLYVGTKAPRPGIGFTYYLNPAPNDRNIEFDPKRNLFTNLKPEEQVTAP